MWAMSRNRRVMHIILAGFIAGLLAVVVTGSSPSSAPAKAKKSPKVRVLNPFHEGVAVQPSKLSYVYRNQKVTLTGLEWQRWGGKTAVATGQTKTGVPMRLTLGRRKRCGLPRTRFYTRLRMEAEALMTRVLIAPAGQEPEEPEVIQPSYTHRVKLGCQVQTLSGSHASSVRGSVRPGNVLYEFPGGMISDLRKWRGWGRGKATAIGVAAPFWPNEEFRWVPGRLTLRKVAYCPRLRGLAYTKVKLTFYGMGIVQGSMPIERATPILLRQVGRANPVRSVGYSWKKWCRGKYRGE